MLKIKHKIGYGLGDTASNIVFQAVANFMLIFYTDVVGLSAAAAGSVLGIVRLIDAFTDPLMGGLADRTRTRWGRYRPYLLWVALPFSGLAILAFSSPDLSPSAKFYYALFTYGALMVAYTAINIPYCALGGVMTSNPRERASLQSYRFMFAMLAAMLVVWLIPKMVVWLGQGDTGRGYLLAMTVMAALAVLCFVGCFFFTFENKTSEEVAESIPLAEGGGNRSDSGGYSELDTHNRSKEVTPASSFLDIFKDFLVLFKNDQWLVVAAISLCVLILFGLRISVAPLYVKYYLGQDEGFLASFLLLSNIAALVGAICTNYVCRFMEKKTLLLIAVSGLALFGFVLGQLSQTAISAAILCFMATQYFQNVVVILMFAMVADTVDYGALKTGKRAMGMTYSGHLLAIKGGFGIGGAAAGWLLFYYGYKANTHQTGEALSGLAATFGTIPSIFAVLCAGLVLFYKLNTATMLEVQARIKAVE